MDKTKLPSEQKGIVGKTLEWAYAKAVVGFSGVDSAYDLGNTYLKQGGTLNTQVDSLIKWQVAKAATSGFVTGLGGVMIMPLTVPANIASVIYVQIRMITAIAYMGGHDIQSDKVKSLIYIAMAGNGAKELLKNTSIKGGEKLLSHIIQKVSMKLVSKTGEKTATNLSKAVPVLGGVIGGSIDAAATRIVGKVAKRIFIDNTVDTSALDVVEVKDSYETNKS